MMHISCYNVCMRVRKEEYMRSQLKHLSKKAQSDVSLKYATWANNHRGKSKQKKMNKRLAKTRYKQLLKNEIEMEGID